MTLLISDLITPEEQADVLATLLAVSALLNAPTTSWQEGAPILALLSTAAQKMADLTTVAVDITKGGFGELLPSDAWADRWALSRFNVTRVPATSAATLATFTCDATAAALTYQAGQSIVAHATTHATYRNTVPVTLGPGLVVPGMGIAADIPGAIGSAAPSTITVMVSSLVGVTVTNPATAIGSDAETTPALVKRARSKLGALSPNGAKDAYNFIATSPDFSATSVPITRTRTVGTPTSPTISVYLATATGAPVGGDVAIVQAAIDAGPEPWGATATAIAATPHSIAITYQSWIKGSQLTTAQIEAAQALALANFFATLDLGGYVIPPDTGDVYVETLAQVIAASVVGTQRVVVSLPAAAVSLAPNEVATLGAISPTTTLL